MPQSLTNLFEIQVPDRGERFETILKNDHMIVETIVSSDDIEPTLYDQPHDEAVFLLEGEATLWIEGETIVLKPGDWLCIRAHQRHKVLSTHQGTRWLAIHTKEPLC